MSQPAAQIYTGPWINWSHGAVLGLTLTLSASHGGLLTAFLAIFVSVAGAACWSIIGFALHQYRAKLEYQDALHHQQQLIFRSNPSPGIAFWQFSQFIYYWRSLAKKPLRRTLPLAILALLNLLLFALAGVFSSEVTKAPGTEALIKSQNCGTINWNTSESVPQSSSIYSSTLLNDSMNAAAYARACYSSAHNPLLCNQYVKQKIPWKTNRNASCPFGENMCILGPHAALGLDTGPISSHDVLGINAPPKDRVNYHKVTTCSPISTSGHVTLWNDTNSTHVAFGDKFFRYWLGGVSGFDPDYTMEYNTHIEVHNIGYLLNSYEKLTNSTPNAWQPIGPLNREDADVSLFLLSANSIFYRSPVSDPFYSANVKDVLPVNDPSNTNLTLFGPDYYVTALACIDQHQYCNPNNGRCTSLTASNYVLQATASLGLNARQEAITNRTIVLFCNIFYSVTGRDVSALRASETLFGNFQIPLPNDQWMIEVSSWFAVGMAKLQQAVVQYATGPLYMPDGAILLGPLTPAEKAMCKSQRVRSPGGTLSFSVLGVTIILTVGSALIVTSLCLDRIVGSMRRRFAFKEYKRLQWVLDEQFQLHCLAYEQAGQGIWAGGTDIVPTTRRGDLLGIPYLQVGEGHPRLRNDSQPDGTSGTTDVTEQSMAGQKTPLSSVEGVDVEGS